MRRILLPLLALSLLGFAPQGEDPVTTVRRWINAVLAHHPGNVDPALIAVAAEPTETFETVARYLKPVLEHDFPMKPLARNDVRRRGALLHSDIAMLLPEQAAAFLQREDAGPLRSPSGSMLALPPQVRREPNALVFSRDGEYMNTSKETAHWAFASTLLNGITPHAPSDEFVRAWYRAIAASFQYEYYLGSGTYHMSRALEILPRDPILLFYAGAMHEALASPAFQNIPSTAPGMAQEMNFHTEDEELHLAERFLREAVSAGAPLEAQLRLARVIGKLGKHEEALALLQRTLPPADNVQFDYFRSLFLGTELGAVGKVDLARESFERAITLFPTAQAPLIAMSDLYRRRGDRASALEAIHRLEALPPDTAKRTDPWWEYFHSYAADADDQLAAVRTWVDAHRDK